MKGPNFHFILDVIYSCQTTAQLQSCLVWISNLMRADEYGGLIALHHITLQAYRIKMDLIVGKYEDS